MAMHISPTRAFVLLLFLGASAASPSATFPAQLTYDVELTMKNVKAGEPQHFVGRHLMDAVENRGRVDWQISSAGDKPSTAPWPFIMTLVGESKEAYQIREVNGSTVCFSFPYVDDHGKPIPIFNATWNAGATFVGQAFWRGRLCNKFTGAYPFFIMGTQYVSDYFQDLFTGAPVAWNNSHLEMTYAREGLVSGSPGPASLFDPTTKYIGMKCSSPPTVSSNGFLP